MIDRDMRTASTIDQSTSIDEFSAGRPMSDPAGGMPNSAADGLQAQSAPFAAPVCEESAGNGHRSMAEPRLTSSARRELVDWGMAPTGAGRPVSTWVAEGQWLLRDTKVLIIDDSKLYREYLAGVVASNAAASPSVAWDLSSLVKAFEGMTPRVILLNTATRDSAMLLRQALKMNPGARVIVMGMSEDDECEIVACAEAGVAGYHMRTESLEDLLLLIRKVAAGESLCSPRVSAILLRRLSALASQRQPVAEEPVLTAREIQILRMLELGLSNKDIAEQLCIAVHTVKNHVHSLLTKLGVSTRTQAASLSTHRAVHRG
jgi:DNA-binding NarL/FixJ family response regulator